MTDTPAVLIGDIGGTNARFALVRDSGVETLERLSVAAFAKPEAALAKVLAEVEGPVRFGLLAVAGPVSQSGAELTNAGWRFDAEDLASGLGLKKVFLLNDFAAQALALPELSADDLIPLGGPRRPDTSALLAVLGPGTGLGVAALLPDDTPLVGEGGHVTLPAVTREEADVLAGLRQRYGHVSAERVLSGEGLVTLYRAVGGTRAGTAAEVTAAVRLHDPAATKAICFFFAFLGTVAGNVALTFGARGGVYLTGGILPRLVPELRGADLYQRFLSKGRFRSYLEAIPLQLVVHSDPALLGLARYARRLGSS
ncbi:glucokinase [Algihabitans albus]|uniref:glucokinase n=1 Tax=Algihabitans albus TaxID=2164067 RepID=UPI000E5CB0FF|nr:glucokinase [Algihabitans albus]